MADVPEGCAEFDLENRPPRERPESFHLQEIGVSINGYPLYALLGPLFPEERKEEEAAKIVKMLASVITQALDGLPEDEDEDED